MCGHKGMGRPWFGLVFVTALLVVAALLAACAPPSRYPRVSLASEPVPARLTPAAPRYTDPPLRVAIAAVISPKSTLRSYAPLLEYLSERVDRPVELLQRQTYAEINDLLRDGRVDVALVCTGAYIRGQRDFGMELLAAPQVNGEVVYYSYIIVPAESQAQGMADLRGKTFAFTDPMSNTGWLMPVGILHQMGERPEAFFGRTIYTYSHDNSIRAVAEGLVDGAAVDSLVYEYALSNDPKLADHIRVIARSEPAAMPPVVVHPGLDANLKTTLKDIFLTMHQHPEGKAALAVLNIDRFVTIDNGAYESVRRVLAGVEEGR